MTEQHKPDEIDEPSMDNGKNFIVYSESSDRVMFEGNILQFNNYFFRSTGWESILDFAKKECMSIAIEGSDAYNNMREPEDAEVAHNEHGELQENGLYDEGGHMLPGRLADVADFLDLNSKY